MEARYKAASIDCPLVVMTRVREPLAYYLSFYKWGVAFRQKEDPRKFGNNFTTWVRRNQNLQSAIMLRGMSAMNAEYYGRLPQRRAGGGRHNSRSNVQNPDWDAIQLLLDKFDVVGSMERFDESLLLAADLSGLPLLLYKRNQPHLKGGFRGSSKSVCPDMDACRRAVQEAAPLDYQMYEKYAAAFEARIRALGAPFEARVAAYKRALVAAQHAWKKAPRKQTICRYHPETTEKVAELRPENIRCPVADSLELCQRTYAHRLFECPWQFQPNSSLTDPLGCWKPSSGFNR